MPVSRRSGARRVSLFVAAAVAATCDAYIREALELSVPSAALPLLVGFELLEALQRSDRAQSRAMHADGPLRAPCRLETRRWLRALPRRVQLDLRDLQPE